LVVPAEIPVTTPPDTLPTAGAVLLHTPPDTDSVNVVLLPGQTVALEGESGAGVIVTVTVFETEQPASDV
jgi:hypothetical protein